MIEVEFFRKIQTLRETIEEISLAKAHNVFGSTEVAEERIS